MGRGLQGPGDRVWGRVRAGVSLDGNGAGMGRECWEWEEWRGEEGELRCRVIVDGVVLGKGVK